MATNTTQNEIRTEEDLSLEELLVKTTLLRPLNKQTAEYDLPPPQEPEIYKDGESKFSIPFLHFASCSTKNVIISHNGIKIYIYIYMSTLKPMRGRRTGLNQG